MPANFPIPTQNVIPGQLITAALWNGEFVNLFNNFDTLGLDNYSHTDGQMQIQTNPFPGSVISRPTATAGELERLRFVVAGITGQTYWYQPPVVTIAAINTFNLGHTHTGAADGTNIPAAGLAANAVTTVKILDANVTDAKIVTVSASKITGTIGTSQIAANAVDETKIAASVAGNGLGGGAGSPLAVNVDGSTIEIVADTLRVKDLGITNAKINDVAAGKITGTIVTSQIGAAQVAYANLAADVTTKLSPKTIQRSSGSLTWSAEVTSEKIVSIVISSVDTTKSYVVLNGISSTDGSNQIAISGEAQLLDATHVQIKGVAWNYASNGTLSKTFTVYFTVVEWN